MQVAFQSVPRFDASGVRTPWHLALLLHLLRHAPRTDALVPPPGKSQMDEHILREKARDAIANGRFPNRGPDRSWGGPGVGAACAICTLPVRTDQMEFEVQFAYDGNDPGLDKYRVHMRCFAAWVFERERSGPTCDVCLMRVRPGEPVVFREDSHVEHAECPVARCIRCLRPLQAGEATTRVGDDVVHRDCPEPLGTGTAVDIDSS